jgi:hypothetical protein
LLDIINDRLLSSTINTIYSSSKFVLLFHG